MTRRFKQEIRDTLHSLESSGRRHLVILLLLTCITAVLISATPLLLKYAIDNPQDAKPYLLMLTACLITAHAITSGTFIIYGKVEQKVLRESYLRKFRKELDGEISYQRSKSAGAVLNRIVQETNAQRILLFLSFFTVFPLSLQLLISLSILVTVLEPTYAIILALGVGIYIYQSVQFSDPLRVQNTQGLAALNNVGGEIIDALINVETVKVYNAAERLESNVRAQLMQASTSWERWYSLRAKLAALNSLSLYGSICITLVLFSFANPNIDTAVGSMAMLVMYLLQLARPIEMLGSAHRDALKAIETISMKDSSTDGFWASRGGPKCPSKKRAVTAEATLPSVSILQENTADATLIEIGSGERILLTGPSGSGKSTLLSAIAGLSMNSSFEVSVTGSARLVSGDAPLFNTSILNNFLYVLNNVTENEIEAHLTSLGLGELLKKLPHRLNTHVGEIGKLISLGEKQRISIARALLASPDILLLDEAISGLDAENEAIAVSHIQTNMKPNGILIVAAHKKPRNFLPTSIIAVKSTHSETTTPQYVKLNPSNAAQNISTEKRGEQRATN